MPKVAQDVLDEFGRAVKRARSLRGWTLDQVANCITPAPGKSFLSNIEKGKRDISATTVGKLIAALDLPENWIDRFLDADIAPEDEETPKDREAERLIRRAEADPNAPDTPEVLLLLLAEEWAGQRFTGSTLAYNALKGALHTAAEMRAQGAMPSNISAQFQAVMRRVAELNDAGLMDEADAALKDARDRNEAESEALFEAELKQDRLRNRPDQAAQRLIKRLRNAVPSGGLFLAVSRLINETRERGEQQGDPYELFLALELAKANQSRAKRPLLLGALSDIGNCHLAIGERQASGGHLTRARNAFAEALRLTSRHRDPQIWAAMQNSLGSTLRSLGDRTTDPAVLGKAIAAHRAAHTIYSPNATPIEWAATQNNLGNALDSLGELTADPDLLEQAISTHRATQTVRTLEAAPKDWAKSQNNLGLSLRRLAAITRNGLLMDEAASAYTAALTVQTRDTAPFFWAVTQWNLADLALARHDLSPDAKHLSTALYHLGLAREVFAQEGNEHQLAECDRLQVLIDVVNTQS